MTDIPTNEEQHGYDARALAKLDAREIAREEIASLCGLMLAGNGWGEALADFSRSSSSPGRNIELDIASDQLAIDDEVDVQPEPAA